MTEPKRILIVNLQRKLYPADRVRNNINYLGGNLDLSDEDITKLESVIPDMWNTDKDRLIKFVLFEDKTYMCQRQKQTYNFSLRETEEKLYFFDVASVQEVDNLVSIFADFYTRTKISKIENLYDKVLGYLSDFSYIKYTLLETRNKLLKDSDYLMMPDYPLSEEEKQKWTEYRQSLRDITDQEAWKNNDFINVIMPPSPEPKYQLVEMLSEINRLSSNTIPPNILESFRENLTGIGIENVIKKFSEITLKLEVLKGISNLKLPFVDIDSNSLSIENIIPTKIQDILPEFDSSDVSLSTQRIVSSWQQYLMDVDNKIETINNTLNTLNINFTIGDIINSVAEHTKKTLDDVQVEQDVQELLTDLELETKFEDYFTDGENS